MHHLNHVHFKSVQYSSWIWRIIKPSMFKNLDDFFFAREFDIFQDIHSQALCRSLGPIVWFCHSRCVRFVVKMIPCFVFIGLECNAIQTNRVESRISIRLPWRKLRKRNDTRFTLWCRQTMFSDQIALTRSLVPFSFAVLHNASICLAGCNKNESQHSAGMATTVKLRVRQMN